MGATLKVVATIAEPPIRFEACAKIMFCFVFPAKSLLEVCSVVPFPLNKGA